MNYKFYLLLGVLLLTGASAMACEMCALYNASRLQGRSPGDLTLAVSHLYTEYDKSKEDNGLRDGEIDQSLNSTHLSLSYDAGETWGLQIDVPVISREFDQIQSYRVDPEHDTDLGDITVAGTYSFLNYKKAETLIVADFMAGLKLPTGDTGSLETTASEADAPMEMMARAFEKHHGINSGSGSPALVFGTGSYDALFGVGITARHQRYLFLGYTQYTLRTEGDFSYEFADDFLWSAGPAYYISLDDDHSVALQVALAGEHKGDDRLAGGRVENSDASNLFLGPNLLLTLNQSIAAEVGMDFRVSDEDKDSDSNPQMRVRASLSYRFS